MNRHTVIPAALVLLAGALVAVTATPAAAGAAPTVFNTAAVLNAPAVDPAGDRAVAAADAHLSRGAGAAAVHRGAGDTLVRRGVTVGGNGLRYVNYARTYKGLPVIGGDAVVVTDAAGAVRSTTAAQSATISVGTTAKVGATSAAATARAQLATVTSVGTPALSVLAWGTPALVWETIVEGATATGAPSRLHVFVDATTGKVIDSYDEVADGTGNGAIYGTVTIATSGSGTSFSMTDPTRPGISCRDQQRRGAHGHRRRVGQRRRHQPRDRLRRRAVHRAAGVGHASAPGSAATASTAPAAASRSRSASTT